MQYGTRYPRVEMRKDTAPDIVRRNLGQTAATHEMDSGRSGYGTPQQTAERLRPAVGMRRIGSVLRNRVDEPLPAGLRRSAVCLPPLNSRSCDAGCEATATDRFTADDAEAVTSPPPDRTAIQASNMVSHLCIESKDNEKIRTVKLFRPRIGAPEDERLNPNIKRLNRIRTARSALETK